MLDVVCHQGNVNQDHSEIPAHTSMVIIKKEDNNKC